MSCCEQHSCPICLEQLHSDDPDSKLEIKTLKVCGHSFHMACVDEWFATEAKRAVQALTCPLCRANVATRVLQKVPVNKGSGRRSSSPRPESPSTPTTRRKSFFRLFKKDKAARRSPSTTVVTSSDAAQTFQQVSVSRPIDLAALRR